MGPTGPASRSQPAHNLRHPRQPKLHRILEGSSPVNISISTEALDLIRDRGGRAAIDFIPPIG